MRCPSRATPIGPRRGARGGLTFIEVVVSLLVVSGLATVIFGAIGFVETAAAMDARRVKAHEIAHRIVIQMVDDENWIEGQPRRVNLGDDYFVFEVSDAYITRETEIDPETGQDRFTSRTRTRSAEEMTGEERLTSQLRIITVSVWWERPDRTIEPERMAAISRVYNPLDTPNDARALQWMTEQLSAGMGGDRDERGDDE